MRGRERTGKRKKMRTEKADKKKQNWRRKRN